MLQEPEFVGVYRREDFASALEEFTARLNEQGLASATVESYRGHALRFMRWLEGEYVPPGVERHTPAGEPWTACTVRAEFEQYAGVLRESALTPDSRYQYLLAVSRFIEFLSHRSVVGLIGPRTDECRLDTPYASIHAVLDSVGLRLCCSHSPQHCTSVLAPVQTP